LKKHINKRKKQVQQFYVNLLFLQLQREKITLLYNIA
jgi:hypothetical protein